MHVADHIHILLNVDPATHSQTISASLRKFSSRCCANDKIPVRLRAALTFLLTVTVSLMQVVVNEIILGLIAGLGCLVGGILLLPSLATDELREVLADVIQTCGMSISGYASRIFPPEEVHPAHAPEQTPMPWYSVCARHLWITCPRPSKSTDMCSAQLHMPSPYTTAGRMQHNSVSRC